MKKNLYSIITLVIVLSFLAAGGLWWQSRAQAATSPADYEVTGVLEARKARLAVQIGGQVLEVLVEAGEKVTTGQVLVKLDDTLLQNQRNQAQAAFQAAQSNLALLQAGATEEQLAAAQAQLDQANASLSAARAGLAAATSGSRPEEVAAARAFLEQARSYYYSKKIPLPNSQLEILRSLSSAVAEKLAGAQGREADLKKDPHNPASDIDGAEATIIELKNLSASVASALNVAQDGSQPNYEQIELARLAWETAQANLTAAQARLDSLEKEDRTTEKSKETAQAALDDTKDLAEKAKAAYDSLTSGPVEVKLEAAWKEVQRAETQLASLSVSRQAVPVPGMLPIETVMVQVEAAAAGRDLATANLDALKRGARSEQLDAAKAQVDLAQAQLQGIDEQIKKLTITAPWDGIVLVRSVEPGETALPGGTLLEIGKLESLELTVYLPEDRLALVKLDSKTTIKVNSYPGKTFTGKVSRMANQAEFTPTNVQTNEDRSRLVYAVLIRVDNPEILLKPGMIVDVIFGN